MQTNLHLLVVSQAYSSSDYDGPPNIDNYFNHPFMKQVDAPAVVSPTADGQPPDRAPTYSGPPSPPPNRPASPDSLRRPARISMKGIHAASAPVPAPAAAAPRADLMDLLSLDDSAAPAQQAAASATNSDGELQLLCYSCTSCCKQLGGVNDCGNP